MVLSPNHTIVLATSRAGGVRVQGEHPYPVKADSASGAVSAPQVYFSERSSRSRHVLYCKQKNERSVS
jgi:hypothetical protein